VNDLAARLRDRQGIDPVLTFGGVSLAIAAIVAYARMGDAGWAAFPLLLLVGIPCAALFYLALAPTDGLPAAAEPVPRWQVALIAVAHALLLVTLISVARVLGVDNPGPGTATWTLAVTGISALFFSERLGSPGLRLLGLLVIAAAVLYLVNWIDDNASTSAYRDVLLAEGVLFLLYARTLHGVREDHSNVAVTAGVVTLVTGATIGVFGGVTASPFLGGLGGPQNLGDNDGWELLLVAVSIGALAYSGWQRYRGTIYPGLAGLGFFFIAATVGNLWGWPVILAVVALACFWWALYGDYSFGARRPATPPTATPPPGAQEESSGM
jgi:hypothetical protein